MEPPEGVMGVFVGEKTQANGHMHSKEGSLPLTTGE